MVDDAQSQSWSSGSGMPTREEPSSERDRLFGDPVCGTDAAGTSTEYLAPYTAAWRAATAASNGFPSHRHQPTTHGSSGAPAVRKVLRSPTASLPARSRERTR